MKKILISIVILLIGFIIFLTFNKSKLQNVDGNNKKHYFESVEIKDIKEYEETNVNYKEKYADEIITEYDNVYEYNFYHNEESITGLIYIGNDNYLYIVDENNNKNKRVSKIKFVKMYTPDYNYIDGIYVYLLSEKGDIYMMSLESNDINDAYLYKYEYEEKFENFVELDLKYDMFKPGNTLFAISTDNKIYEINTGLLYDERTVSLYNSIYVYYDKTMSNTSGYSVKNKNGELYKIKYIFSTHSNSKMFKDFTPVIIITEDDKFIYFDNEMMNVYEFDKKVKEVKFDQYYPYLNGNLEITFEDDYKAEFTARCNEYYCINEFAE